MQAKFLAILISALLAETVFAQDTQPAPGGFIVQHWAVWVVDATQNQLNSDGTFTSSLPEFVASHRQTTANSSPQPAVQSRVMRVMVNGGVMLMAQNVNAPAAAQATAPMQTQVQPQPIGVIRLVGQSDSKVDVALTKADGDFAASWPEAQVRSRQLLWRNRSVSDQLPSRGLRGVRGDHWFNLLRAGPSAYLSDDDGNGERFLLYDLQMPYNSPLTAKSSKDFSAVISNTGEPTLRNLTLYQGDHGAWRTASIGDLPKSAAPATRPTTEPSGTVHLTMGATTQPADLAAAWKPKLAAAGLNDSDCQYIVNAIQTYAFDPRRLTAVYLMDEKEFDRVASLEVLPQPAKTVELGVVIICNADPSAGSEVDDLIAQLGDPVWANREAAYKALEQIGKPAIPKLQAATNNRDLEIVWRAERLLSELGASTP